MSVEEIKKDMERQRKQYHQYYIAFEDGDALLSHIDTLKRENVDLKQDLFLAKERTELAILRAEKAEARVKRIDDTLNTLSNHGAITDHVLNAIKTCAGG